MSDFSMRRRGAFGASPIDPRLFPLALLRSSEAIKDANVLADGVAELDRNLATGTAMPWLPRRMMQTQHKPAPDGGGPPPDPRQSAWQIAAAFSAAGRLAPAVNEITMPPADAEAARAMLDARSRLMFPQSIEDGDTIPEDPSAQAAPTHFPDDAEMRAAYGGAVSQVEGQSAERRATLIGTAMAQLSAQSAKVLQRIRGR